MEGIYLRTQNLDPIHTVVQIPGPDGRGPILGKPLLEKLPEEKIKEALCHSHSLINPTVHPEKLCLISVQCP